MLYIKKPTNFKSQFEVVSCFFEYNGKILLLKRHNHKTQGGKWGVPAGKSNSSEDTIVALVREIFEETGCTAKQQELDFFRSVYVTHPEHQFIYHIFHHRLKKKPTVSINPQEHQEYLWTSPREALNMNLVDDLDTCIKMYYFSKEKNEQHRN